MRPSAEVGWDILARDGGVCGEGEGVVEGGVQIEVDLLAGFGVRVQADRGCAGVDPGGLDMLLEAEDTVVVAGDAALGDAAGDVVEGKGGGVG